MGRTQPETLVVVGKRAGALRAAARSPLEVVLLCERRPSKAERETLADYRVLDFRTVDWEALARELGRTQRIRSVAAAGEHGVVPAARIREALAIPGLNLETALRCIDKPRMKLLIWGAGLACTTFAVHEDELDRETLVERLGLPMVLKDRAGVGGRNSEVARTPAEVPLTLAPDRMAERFVHGVEMSVESFVHRGEVLWTNLTEYLIPLWANVVPADLDPGVADQVLDLNRRAIRALGISRGMTHMEVFLTANGPMFGEIAARPPGGRIMELIEVAYGFDPWEAWLAVEDDALPQLVPTAQRRAAVQLLHPDAGTVASIDGLEAAASVPGVKRVHCRLKEGTRVDTRLGSGQECGHVLTVGEDRETAVRSLNGALGHIVIRIA